MGTYRSFRGTKGASSSSYGSPLSHGILGSSKSISLQTRTCMYSVVARQAFVGRPVVSKHWDLLGFLRQGNGFCLSVLPLK